MTTTSASLDELLDELHHPQVRDLAWVIGSAHLIDQAGERLAQQTPRSMGSLDESMSALGLTSSEMWRELQMISELNPKDELSRHASTLRALDRDPHHLLTSLDTQRARHPRVRLGVYFEHLVTYWLSSLLGIAPLYREIQIHEPQARGVKTLGALDLVGEFALRQGDTSSSRSSSWIHIEVATKFYLEREEAPFVLASSPAQKTSWINHPWIDQLVGPNEHDSLGKKLRRLLRHQLPMSAHPRARDLLDEMGVAQIEQRLLWLKGRLFRWAGDQSETSVRPLWVRIGQLEQLERHLGPRWRALHRPKPGWLAPPTVAELEMAPLLTISTLQHEATSARGERGATLWYMAAPDLTERGWVMIVPNDWCDRD